MRLFTHLVTPCAVALMSSSFLAVPVARAAYTINVQQVGSDVVATGSGSLNTAGLTFQATGFGMTYGVGPDHASLDVGSDFSGDNYVGVSGPTSFGPGGFTTADSSTGNAVGVSGSFGALLVPEQFTSGGLGTSTDTWNNQTIASLGLIPGTYAYSLPNDTFTVNVLPEPATVGVLAFVGAPLLRRGRRARVH